MKISLILAHPNKNSFNHAIAHTAVDTLSRDGHRVLFHDLYEEQFDPIMPSAEIARSAILPPLVEEHCREIVEADGIIVVHPNWWGQLPAILKGWVDRVIRPGVAYEFLEGDQGEGVPHGLLKARTAVVFNTGNTEAIREKEVFGDPLESIWKSCIFDLCGVHDFYRRLFGIVITSTEAQRKAWLAEVEQMLTQVFPSE